MRLFALACLLFASAAPAQVTPPTNSKPAAASPKVERIPVARDIPYPGTVEISLDTTDNIRGIFRVRQRVPVTGPGDLVMLFPEWIPGNHKAAGELLKVAGIRFTGNGQPLRWRRDPLNVFAFHVDVPPGVQTVDVEFQHISATASAQGRIVSTPEMQSIRWWSASMYPAGHYVRNIPVRATVTVPPGWTVATASAERAGGRQPHHLRSGQLPDADRLADDRRAQLPAHPARAQRQP